MHMIGKLSVVKIIQGQYIQLTHLICNKSFFDDKCFIWLRCGFVEFVVFGKRGLDARDKITSSGNVYNYIVAKTVDFVAAHFCRAGVLGKGKGFISGLHVQTKYTNALCF